MGHLFFHNPTPTSVPVTTLTTFTVDIAARILREAPLSKRVFKMLKRYNPSWPKYKEVTAYLAKVPIPKLVPLMGDGMVIADLADSLMAEVGLRLMTKRLGNTFPQFPQTAPFQLPIYERGTFHSFFGVSFHTHMFILFTLLPLSLGCQTLLLRLFSDGFKPFAHLKAQVFQYSFLGNLAEANQPRT
jgi:hypothetical protein